MVFAPKHPLLRAKLARETEAYEDLGLREVIAEAVFRAEALSLSYPIPTVE